MTTTRDECVGGSFFQIEVLALRLTVRRQRCHSDLSKMIILTSISSLG